MKTGKMTRILAFILMLAMLPMVQLIKPVTAEAAGDAKGLAGFPDTKTWKDGVFSDVPAGAWYADSVKTVYCKGIMKGVSGGRFGPSNTVHWSDAVTIAARLHATYNGTKIEKTGGAWYAQYIAYAEKNGLLPYTFPGLDKADKTNINRQEMAELFCRVLSDKDLPTINDRAVPDIKDVDPAYAANVQAMYGSGIFTGKSGNKFDPKGLAKRDEIATIVTRLLIPAERSSRDSKINSAMKNQYGNFGNGGGWAVTVGDIVYYDCSEMVGVGEKYTKEYHIVSRTSDGVCKVVWSSSEMIEKLSTDSAGLLYFILGGEKLTSLDPKTGTTKTLYNTGGNKVSIETYIFYGDETYILTQDSNPTIDNWKYVFGRLNGGRLEELLSATYTYASNMTETLHIFGDKAYFAYAVRKADDGNYMKKAVCSLDLKTKKLEQVSEEMFHCGFSGAVAWYVVEKDKTMTLKRISLVVPEVVETYRELTKDEQKNYSSIFANGGSFYYQSSGAKKIWKMAGDGSFKEIASMSATGYESCTVNKQGTIIQGHRFITYCPGAVVDTPDGKRVSYLDFLGLPAIYQDERPMETAVDWKYDLSGERVVIDMTRCGFDAEGDLVVVFQVKNNGSSKFSTTELQLSLAGTDIEKGRTFSAAKTLKSGDMAAFSVVVPKSMLGKGFDINDRDAYDFWIWYK